MSSIQRKSVSEIMNVKEAPLESAVIDRNSDSEPQVVTIVENVRDEDASLPSGFSSSPVGSSSSPSVDNEDPNGEGEGQPVRTRHANLWFEDGNFIIVARNVEFRIYRGPLAKHSSFFRDLLLHPQLAVNNCLPTFIVRDHPEDITAFLRSFGLGEDLCFSTKRPQYNTISALIRLGIRYSVSETVKSGVKYLKACYPRDYWAMKKRPNGAPDFKKYEHIGVINLARATEAYELLPMAFLRCCALEPEKLEIGFRRTDGKKEMLTPADLERVVIGRQLLLELDATIFERWAKGQKERACDNEGSNVSCVEYLALKKKGGLVEGRGNWTADWTDSYASFANDGKPDAPCVCSDCLLSLMRLEDREREAFWSEWPDMLRLDEWEL